MGGWSPEIRFGKRAVSHLVQRRIAANKQFAGSDPSSEETQVRVISEDSWILSEAKVNNVPEVIAAALDVLGRRCLAR